MMNLRVGLMFRDKVSSRPSQPTHQNGLKTLDIQQLIVKSNHHSVAQFAPTCACLGHQTNPTSWIKIGLILSNYPPPLASTLPYPLPCLNHCRTSIATAGRPAQAIPGNPQVVQSHLSQLQVIQLGTNTNNKLSMHTEQPTATHSAHQPPTHTPPAHRRTHINRIRHSLKDFALISKNKTMVQKKLSLQSQTLSQNGSSDGLSLDYEERTGASPYQHAQVFAEKYEIISKLGEGSDGVVHRCRKKRSGLEYAVKSFMFDDEHIPQIRTNFVLVKGLAHRNIIQYEALYLDLQKHACWLVMELFDAPSLARLTLTSELQLKQISQQLLQTLHYLHQRAVSHRDIKTENILYDPLSKRLKLIDYGICRKHRRRGTKFEMLTITGTLYYRAPEMFSGGGYNEKVDIWSTGITIYKLITGRTPFESEYHSKTINNIMSAELTFPPAFDRYSPSLRNLVAKMLKKDPKERPSALDCLRDMWFYSTGNSYPHNLMLNQELNEEDLECLKSPVVEWEDEGSFIRKINGEEFHCFDSDDEGARKGVGMKRVHRSTTVEVGYHSLSGFSL